MFKHLMLIGALGASGCAVVQRLVPARGSQAHPAAATTAADAALPHLPDDGITSQLHRDFVGQIVFAPHQIAKDSDDTDQLAAEFYADEPLYGRAYLPQSIENVAVYEPGSAKALRSQTRGYMFELFVDGKHVEQSLDSGTVSEDRHASTTLQVWPHPQASDDATPRGWVELVNALSPGTHRIRIELWAHDRFLASRAPLAAGELTIHKDASTKLGAGRSFATLDHGMSDPTLQGDLVGIVRGFARKQGWKESFTDVAIRSPAWVEVREKVMHRQIARRLDAWARAEWSDGHCTAQAVTFEQHVDRGQPTGPMYVGSSGEQALIDCAASTSDVAVEHWNGKSRARPTPTATAPAPTSTVAAGPPSHTTTGASTPSTTSTTSASTPSTTAATPPLTASSPPSVVSSDSPATARGPLDAGRFELGLGVAANARESAAVASFAHVGVHLGRVELGVGATWPLNALVDARFAIVSGRFELAPMLTATVLGEANMSTEVALGGGVSLGFLVHRHVGLRLEALVAYDLHNAGIAVPVIGSTCVRF